MPRVAFITLGCRVNQAETARLMAQFSAAGFSIARSEDPCDAVVVHGCAVTREAERQSRQAARAALRRTPPPRAVVLAGCAAEAIRRFGNPHLLPSPILLAGQAEKESLPSLVASALGLCTLSPSPNPAGVTPCFNSVRAWLKVQDGCDFHCAYCLVPHLRGAARSRPFAEIQQEARRLIDAGVRELVITGINIGCWRDGPRRLPDLLDALSETPGLLRLRLGSLELSTVEEAVITLMAERPRLAPYLHIPLQSGDDGILRAMGRRYSVDHFRRTLEIAFARIPHLGVGTDVIAGFPGETEASFQRTLDLLESFPIHNIHAFPFSERPGTPARTLCNPIPPAERRARVRRIQELARLKRRAAIERRIGQMVEVLIEDMPSNDTGHGWSGDYLEATVRHSPPPGSLARVIVLTPWNQGFLGETQ